MINRRKQNSITTNDTYISENVPQLDFSKIRIGSKKVEDAVLQLGDYRKVDTVLADKAKIYLAIRNGDYDYLREVSRFYFRSNGIYSRLCRYMAYMFKYDWMVTPQVNSDKINQDKLLTTFNSILNYMDSFYIKRFFGEVALKVIKNGCYYGYIVDNGTSVAIQELDPGYCRSRYSTSDGTPLVEFNMKFFSDRFRSSVLLERVLNIFPKEFKKGWRLYQEGKLVADYPGDQAGWYLLDPEKTIKFNLNGQDYPIFVATIPHLIDLDEAQDLELRKMKQELLKIIIQKMPMDKNGDLVFDPDEAQQLHNNAIRMLSKAVGVDVLTTFADVEVADMQKSKTAADDNLAKIERSVFNDAGVGENLFNSDGNIALEKSSLNDEALMLNLIQQFEIFLNHLLKKFNTTPKKILYKASILPTTIYNYKELAKQFKEMTQLGYSKMLPMIALGQSQSSILANAYFENDILDLVNVFIPPLSSNVMNADVLNRNKGGQSAEETGSTGGRPPKEEGERSDKTIANQESMS